jgi:DNA-binding CsgD family transcriptional regulator
MSRPQAMHQNSIAAYRAEEPRLSKRAAAVLAWVTEHGPHTDRQVAAGMGFSHRSAVQPRITELVEQGLLMEVCSRKCPETGKTVRVVDIRRPRQMDLLS